MRAILYDRTCRCPSSELARRALAEAHVEYDSRPLDTHPIDREGALGLARSARRFLVKTDRGFLERDAAHEPVSEAEALAWLLHEDGLLRVPVLVWGDLLVRGFMEELYERALAAPPAGDS